MDKELALGQIVAVGLGLVVLASGSFHSIDGDVGVGVQGGDTEVLSLACSTAEGMCWGSGFDLPTVLFSDVAHCL